MIWRGDVWVWRRGGVDDDDALGTGDALGVTGVLVSLGWGVGRLVLNSIEVLHRSKVGVC